MPVRVNATRMELMRLRRRRTIAVRGHSLLEDKLEGLTREFMLLIDEYRTEREEVERELITVLRRFTLAGLDSSRFVVSQALSQARADASVTVGTRRIMGVNVPTFRVEAATGMTAYSPLDAPIELDAAIASLHPVYARLIHVAELQETIRIMAEEIERTRRRKNALEYTLIPQINEGIRTIRQKLEELERGNITRLMKVKEIIAETRAAG